MKSYVAAALLVMTLATACGGSGDDGADEPAPSEDSPSRVPVEATGEQITVGGKRYYNACQLSVGLGLADALDTRYGASIRVQEVYAEAGGEAVSTPGGKISSSCTLSSLGPGGDTTVQVEASHWRTSEEADLIQSTSPGDEEPVGSVADLTAANDEVNQGIYYSGRLDETTLIAITVRPNLDPSVPAVPLDAVRRQVDPVVEEMVARAPETSSQAAVIGGSTYGEATLLDPCTLLDAPAAEEAFARDQQLTSEDAKALDASNVLRSYQPGSGELAPGDLPDAGCTRSTVDVDGTTAVVFASIDFYPSADRAADEFEIFGRDAVAIDGLGVPAVLDDTGRRKVLTFVKGPYLIELGITWAQTPGADPVYAETAEELTPLARTIIAKVP